MARPRREIYSGQVYEICMRTRQGLPFVFTKYMKLILESVIARVQRDSKVTLCHHTWMKMFKVRHSEEVKEINEKIHNYLRTLEYEAKEKRKKEKKKVPSLTSLRAMPIDLTYIPMKPSRRIFTYSLDTSLRVYLIEKYKEFCRTCMKCYDRWKLGDYSVMWPKGAFIPPMPHIKNNFIEELECAY